MNRVIAITMPKICRIFRPPLVPGSTARGSCTGKDAVDSENDLAGSSSDGEKPDQPLAELGSEQTSEQIADQPRPTCAIKPISITSAEVIKNVLVTTIAGAKGAVTLSIILTLPLTTQSGAAFPQRDLLITIAAGVILATLFLADNLLPALSKSPEADSDLPERLHKGEIAVLEATLAELRRLLQSENAKAKYLPALRLTITRYTNRLFASRITVPGSANLSKSWSFTRQKSSRNASRSYESAILKHTTPFRGIKLSMTLLQSAGQ